MRLEQRINTLGVLQTVLLPRPLHFSIGRARRRDKAPDPDAWAPPFQTTPPALTTEVPDVTTQILDSQAIPLNVSGTDSDGVPVSPAALTFSLDSAGQAIGSLVQDPSNPDTTWFVTTHGTGAGTATVTASDTETDGDNFLGSLAIDVVTGPVSAIEITAGAAVDRSQAPSAQPVNPVNPTPPNNPPANPVLASQPVYEAPASTTPDPATWPPATDSASGDNLVASDGTALYFYSQDTPGGAATGDGIDGMSVYTGDLQLGTPVNPGPAQPNAPGA